MKWSSSTPRSSGRSRSGGNPHLHDLQAVVEVVAEVPLGDRGLEVAVGRGHDAGVDLQSRPCRRRGGSVRFSITRSRRLCSRIPISPISSRKIVPLPASSNRPSLRALASVNAPFSWPNSSLSSSVSGTAAQLISISGSVALSPFSWIARATISLPLPLSPWIRIEVSLPARLWPIFSSMLADPPQSGTGADHVHVGRAVGACGSHASRPGRRRLHGARVAGRIEPRRLQGRRHLAPHRRSA